MSTRDGAAEAGREAEVLARLATVTDPELDEPVTDLGFVEERDGRRGRRGFHRLPPADLLVRRELCLHDG